MGKLIFIVFMSILNFSALAVKGIPLIDVHDITLPKIKDEDVPKVPKLPGKDLVEKDKKGIVLGIRKLEKNTTIMMEAQVKVVVPLEILSDIDINTVVIDNEKNKIPFDIELNKKPDQDNYYKINFSETNIDIDKDGIIDTKIYSPDYINTKIVKGSYITVDGSAISKEGTYKKTIYMTIGVRE